jgi:tetratricopeptide (TPR) repeat protein
MAPAIQALNRAMTGDPSLAEAAYSLGMLYESQGEKPKALAAYQSALKARPDYSEASAAVTRLGGSVETAAARRRLDGGQTMR